jgi:antitoxin Xre/MbcA/ParS-like protein
MRLSYSCCAHCSHRARTLVSITATGLHVSRQGRTKRYTPRSQIAAAARLSPANRNRHSGSALRIFLSIADLWKLTELQRRLALGYPSRATFYLWSRCARHRTSLTLSVDVLSRISTILGIQQVLEELFATEQAGVDWLHESDPVVFGGQSPLSLITSGFYDDILTVHQYLDSKHPTHPQGNRIANALGRMRPYR